MKKFASTVTGKAIIGAMVVFALVTVAFVSPRLVSAASMPDNSGIQTAVKHVTYEEALERLIGQPEAEQDGAGLNDADSKGDQMGASGQVNESASETADTSETTQATGKSGDSMSGQDASQGSNLGQDLSQTIRTDIVNTLANHGIDISIPDAGSNH